MDELRRAMGFKRSKQRMLDIETRLREGMARNGITGGVQDRIVQSITSFALYGFPESHAASFALLAYASAYFKCHYLAAFTCALLNNQPMGFYSPAVLVKDAQRHGLRVLPVDVNVSEWDCTDRIRGTCAAARHSVISAACGPKPPRLIAAAQALSRCGRTRASVSPNSTRTSSKNWRGVPARWPISPPLTAVMRYGKGGAPAVPPVPCSLKCRKIACGRFAEDTHSDRMTDCRAPLRGLQRYRSDRWTPSRCISSVRKCTNSA